MRKIHAAAERESTRHAQNSTYLDVGDVVGADLDVDDAAGLLAHDGASVLQTDDRATVADKALDHAGELRAGGGGERCVAGRQAPPRSDCGFVVRFGESNVEQRTDGGIARTGGRQGL